MELLTVTEVAAVLKVPRRWVRDKLIRGRRVDVVTICGRNWIKKESFDEYLSRNTTARERAKWERN